MDYDEIIEKVADDMCLPKILVKKSYRAYWKAIKEHIEGLPLMQDLTDEEFMALRTNVNIPSLGKIYVTLDRYKNIKKYLAIRKKIKENKNVKD